MASASETPRLQTAHVVFVDIIGYSLLATDEQTVVIHRLQSLVRELPDFPETLAAGELICIPTGDGMAIVCFGEPTMPVRFARDLAIRAEREAAFALRIGLHTGPVYCVPDINANKNVAGSGINLAQRIMDCGDRGHILLSQSMADTLLQLSQWRDAVKDLGECEVKHGVRLRIFNLVGSEFGNADVPTRIRPGEMKPGPDLATIPDTGPRPPAPNKSQTPQRQPSIAVLPFANLTADKDNEYFSDGLAEEIINVLANVPGLKVIARTSAFAFKGQNTDIRRIAELLGVSTVLEGSVRRAGNRIRVTAQLISAEDGTHLLSERYDREMADIFAMQDEMAAAIAAALRIKLSIGPAERRQYIPNLPAYEAVLKARHHLCKLTPDSMARGREYLAQAIALDPGYALPHSELGFHFEFLGALGMMRAHEAMPLARDAARKALAMDPTQPEALGTLGGVTGFYDYDWDEAGRLFGLAAAQGHSSPIVHNAYAVHLTAIGRAAEAIEEDARAVSDDPLNPLSRFSLAVALMANGQAVEAEKECRRAIELDERYGFAWLFLSMASLYQGKINEALPAAEKAVSVMPWYPVNQGVLAALLALTGDEDGAGRTLQRLGAGNAYGAPAGFVYYFLIRGEIDQAARWAEKAIEERWPFIISNLRLPHAAGLRQSSRWSALAKMMNLPDAPQR